MAANSSAAVYTAGPTLSYFRHPDWLVTRMRLLISAGEASGEMYGAQLIDALRRRVPDF